MMPRPILCKSHPSWQAFVRAGAGRQDGGSVREDSGVPARVAGLTFDVGWRRGRTSTPHQTPSRRGHDARRAHPGGVRSAFEAASHRSHRVGPYNLSFDRDSRAVVSEGAVPIARSRDRVRMEVVESRSVPSACR